MYISLWLEYKTGKNNCLRSCNSMIYESQPLTVRLKAAIVNSKKIADYQITPQFNNYKIISKNETNIPIKIGTNDHDENYASSIRYFWKL